MKPSLWTTQLLRHKVLFVALAFALFLWSAIPSLAAPGDLDPTFGIGGKVSTPIGSNSGAYAQSLETGGRIIAAGWGYDGANSGAALAKYSTDGSLDTSFGTGGKVVTPFPGGGVADDVALQSDSKIVVLGSRRNSSTDFEFALFRYLNNTLVTVANVEELYSAVNNPANAGSQIVLAPGVYMLSVNEPGGAARPNGGRLELQGNMSLQGVVGDRGAVVIDAINLPASSYDVPLIGRTGAIRMGRGTNALEWMTVRNAVNGPANIETELVSSGTSYIRIAHVASSGSDRGVDLRNVSPAMAGRVIEAQIVDNDLFNNTVGSFGEGLRIVNNAGANGGVISATLSGNRIRNNYIGLLVENNGSSLSRISVSSSHDQFDENGLGSLVGAGLSTGGFANGNTVSFTAQGTSWQNNNGISNFDVGGLVVIGGENAGFPNGTSDNTVNVELRGCRLANNQLYDLAAFGARSNPESIGTPGTGNTVTLYLRGITPKFRTQVFVNSLPVSPGSMNTVVLTGFR